MKKLIVLGTVALLLLGTNKSLAQQLQGEFARNEVSLNVLNVLVFGALDVSYERVLSDQTSLSLDVFSKVFNKNEGENTDFSRVYDKNFSLTSEFKFFLDEEKVAEGFYAEVFGMLSSGENEKEVQVADPVTNTETWTTEEVAYTDFALGVGIGMKYVARRGFLLDLGFGIGRNFLNRDSPDFVLLPSASIGYRF